MDVYFPFLDGALGYDCPRCGSRCCHGLGFGVGRSELVPLLRRRPEVAPFVQLAGAHANVIDLTDEGCWFLGADGRCRVEVEEGRAAKPTICRLFPFTRVYRIGETTVVEPHLLLCPLEDARGAGVRHGDILADLEALGDDAPLLRATLPSGLPDDWVARERAALATTSSHLDAASPLALQAALSPDGGARLAALWSSWCRSFGDPTADPTLARSMALLTPTLRFATLFGGAGSPYPKLAARLPSLVLATAFLGSQAAQALGGRSPSLRSIGELHRAAATLRDLLSRWDRPAWLGEPPRPIDLPPELGPSWERLLSLLQRPTPAPLGEAFDEAAAAVEPPLRPVLARVLADRAGALRYR